MNKLTPDQLAAIGNIIAIARQHQLPPLLIGVAHASTGSYPTRIGNSGSGCTTSLLLYTRRQNGKLRGIRLTATEPHTDRHTATHLNKGDSVYIAALPHRLGENELQTIVIHSQPLPKYAGKTQHGEQNTQNPAEATP